MRERISQISVSSRKNLSPGFRALDTCISPAKSICDFDALVVHFPPLRRMFAEYRRSFDESAVICFIHFSHSKFITFRKTDSFIPRARARVRVRVRVSVYVYMYVCWLLFSVGALDINDYGQSRLILGTNLSPPPRASVPCNASLSHVNGTEDKMLHLRRLIVKLYYSWKNARPRVT